MVDGSKPGRLVFGTWLYGPLFALALFAAACSNHNRGSNTLTAAAVPENDGGKELFVARCSGCHLVNKELTGPALAGVRSRWQDSALLYAFIRNSDSVIAFDAYARDLYLRYNQTPMQKHGDLTDAQIDAILNYIDRSTVKK